jgi:hypothetical protein
MLSSVELYIVMGGLVSLIYYLVTDKKRREKYIKRYEFPLALYETLPSKFSETEKEQIVEALRAYFLILNQANNAKFFVPSLILLKTWRAFIELDEYRHFSKKSFAEVIEPPTRSKKINKNTLRNAFKTVWSLSQDQENIEDKKSRKLPSIFELDKNLNIPKGTVYRFKKNKQRGSKKKRKQIAEGTLLDDASFSITYTSDEYAAFSFEIGSMEFSCTSEEIMSEYHDNVSDNSSSSSSSESNSSGSGSWFSGGDDSSSSSSSSSSSDGGSSSDSGGGD